MVGFFFTFQITQWFIYYVQEVLSRMEVKVMVKIDLLREDWESSFCRQTGARRTRASFLFCGKSRMPSACITYTETTEMEQILGTYNVRIKAMDGKMRQQPSLSLIDIFRTEHNALLKKCCSFRRQRRHLSSVACNIDY